MGSLYGRGENNVDINVICVPELPENITIDQYNNIHYNINVGLQGLLDKEYIDIYICDLDKDKKNVKIKVSDLRITKYQTIILRNEGIATIDTEDSYNIDELSDIIFHISLV